MEQIFKQIKRKAPTLVIAILAGTLLLGIMAFKFISEKEIAKVDEKQIEQYESNPQVILDTTMGSIVIELFHDKAPISVANFLDYLDSGFYNGSIFHRVIPGFMIQGGGFTEDMDEKKTGSPIKNEAGNGLSNLRGTIAMARTSVVDSATSQFFINTVDNFFLNHQNNSPEGYGYCVFGKVIEGMEVVDAIQNVPTGTYGYFEDVPLEPVLIKTACRNNQSN
jgi:cyclophilin family peptidyl-prolyl cis-trans isomerase